MNQKSWRSMVHAGRCLVYLKSWFSVRKVNFSEPKTFESRILVDPNFLPSIIVISFIYFLIILLNVYRFRLVDLVSVVWLLLVLQWLPGCCHGCPAEPRAAVASGRHPPRPVHRSFARVGPKWSRNGAEISEMELKWRRNLCTGSRNWRRN